MTRVVDTIGQLRSQLDRNRVIGLVPTMGALHEGHARLIARARDECGVVVVSIFVNPLQFDRRNDLERYPRTPDADRGMCEQLGVDLVFAPDASEMYPAPPLCTVDVSRIADHLCGRYRPGHFRGVATVVMKLLQIVQPERAYFGEKDAQQLAVIRRMVGDLNVPVTIVEVPTVREADGLAISSRNRHLSREERRSATVLYGALQIAAQMISAGQTDADAVKQAAAAHVAADPAVRLEYLEVVDPDDMQPVSAITKPVRLAGAIWIGSTRLIDNIFVDPP
jgi:pantoate--beta-alanine ligase